MILSMLPLYIRSFIACYTFQAMTCEASMTIYRPSHQCLLWGAPPNLIHLS